MDSAFPAGFVYHCLQAGIKWTAFVENQIGGSIKGVMRILRRFVCGVVVVLVGFMLIQVYPVGAVSHNNVPIIVYHHIGIGRGQWFFNPTKFEAQLEYLSENGYHTVTLAAYLDAEQKGAQLPEKSVILTFDDGYRDAYENAFPLLKKYGMIGTFFVITGMVGFPAYLTWDQITEMHRAGMEFAAHTVDHPFLTRLSPLRAFWEIWKSRFDLEWHLNVPVTTFAYPYNDHNKQVDALVRLAGFRGACIVDAHSSDTKNDLFQIPRITVLPAERLKTFALMIEWNSALSSPPRPAGEHELQLAGGGG